jgi:hypothetical protein
MAQGFSDRSFPERYERDARVTSEERTVGDPAYPDLIAILRYWSTKRGERFAPPRSAIDPTDFIEALPRVKLVDVLRGPDGKLDFRFRLAGRAICSRRNSAPWCTGTTSNVSTSAVRCCTRSG